MAQKIEPAFSISKAELAKLPRSEQRRLTELGYVEGVDAPEPAPEGKTAK